MLESARMFERFSDKVREALNMAQRDARTEGFAFIDASQIALAAAKVIRNTPMPPEPAPGPRIATGHLPFTPLAKKALEDSLRVALAEDPDPESITITHLLIAAAKLAKEDWGGTEEAIAQQG
jgi:hypothetical protein